MKTKRKEHKGEKATVAQKTEHVTNKRGDQGRVKFSAGEKREGEKITPIPSTKEEQWKTNQLTPKINT